MKIVIILLFLSMCACTSVKNNDRVACELVRIVKPPEGVYELTNDYLIAQTGSVYFEKNFKVEPDKNFGYLLDDCSLFYRVAYDYLPVSEFFEEKAYFRVYLNWPENSWRQANNSKVLMADGKPTLPKITKEEASIFLAKHLGSEPLNRRDYDLYPWQDCKTESSWCWLISFKKDEYKCREEFVQYQIDLVSGEVKESLSGSVCY